MWCETHIAGLPGNCSHFRQETHITGLTVNAAHGNWGHFLCVHVTWDPHGRLDWKLCTGTVVTFLCVDRRDMRLDCECCAQKLVTSCALTEETWGLTGNAVCSNCSYFPCADRRKIRPDWVCCLWSLSVCWQKRHEAWLEGWKGNVRGATVKWAWQGSSTLGTGTVTHELQRWQEAAKEMSMAAVWTHRLAFKTGKTYICSDVCSSYALGSRLRSTDQVWLCKSWQRW